MQILFTTSHHINATIHTVKAWLSNPARFRQLSPIAHQFHWEVFAGSKFVGYRSHDHHVQLIFTLNETPIGTRVDQVLLVTESPALPPLVLTPLVHAAFAPNLNRLEQLLADQ